MRKHNTFTLYFASTRWRAPRARCRTTSPCCRGLSSLTGRTNRGRRSIGPLGLGKRTGKRGTRRSPETSHSFKAKFYRSRTWSSGQRDRLHCDDPSSNPTEVYNFSVKLVFKRTKINKKVCRGLAHLKDCRFIQELM